MPIDNARDRAPDAMPDSNDQESAPAASPAGAVTVLPPLKERHRLFVLEYVIDLNGRAAAVRAGYSRSRASSRASELIRRPEVQAFIREEMKAREQRLRLSGERIMREAMRIAFADPGRIAHWGPEGVTLVESDDLTADDRAAVKWISVGGSKGATAQRFEMHDKLAALDLLARMTGMLTRPPRRGRFALLEDAQQTDEAGYDAKAELRARLQRIMRGGEE